jgi:hypothetical protein
VLNSAREAETNRPAFESSLERDFFLLLEFDRSVRSWYPQPYRIRVPAGNGRRATNYTPDVLVERFGSVPGECIVTIYEVKMRDDLRTNWASYEPRFRAATRFANERGMRFKTVTEREIRTYRLENAKLLLPYGNREVDDEATERVVSLLDRSCQTTPQALMNTLSSSRWEQALYLPSLWKLVCNGRIECDLDQRLTMHTPIRLAA